MVAIDAGHDSNQMSQVDEFALGASGGIALHVITRYLRGGSERRVRDIVAALDEFDHHFVIGAESDPELAADQLGASQITVEPSLRRRPQPFDDVRASIGIRRVIKSLSPDLVFTHQSKAGALGRVAARSAGRPVTVHSLSMANFGEGYSRTQSSLFRWIEKALSPWTDAYAVVGRDLADRYRSLGIPADKLHVVRSGVPIPIVAESAEAAKHRLGEELAIPVDRPWLIHVGSLEERKNVLTLPRVVELLAKTDGEPPHLLLAGEGPQEEELRTEIADRDLESRCSILGYVDGVSALIKASDVLVLLSSAEGLPQVLVQAASVGTPFVSYRVDGAMEMQGLGARGIVVEPGDVAATVPAIRLMMEDEDQGANVDFGSWAPAKIREDYRDLVKRLLRERQAIATRRGR